MQQQVSLWRIVDCVLEDPASLQLCVPDIWLVQGVVYQIGWTIQLTPQGLWNAEPFVTEVTK